MRQDIERSVVNDRWFELAFFGLCYFAYLYQVVFR
jgi:hypothetical protein